MTKNNTLKGIICILLAAVGFSFMTFFVRISGDLPTMEKAFFRNIVALFVVTVALCQRKTGISVSRENTLPLFARCFFGTSGIIANFYAVDKLGIADANMLNKLSPFFAIILSIFILKEYPKKVDIIATIVAFIGALFIIRPTGIISEVIPALIGLFGGFGAGTAYVYARKLGNNGVATPVIVFYFSCFSTLATLPFLITNFQPMSATQLLCLLMAGISASLGQFSITTAYKYAPAKEISVFDYTQVVFAAILGILFLGEVPSLLSILGYIIIIGVAVFRWYLNLKNS